MSESEDIYKTYQEVKEYHDKTGATETSNLDATTDEFKAIMKEQTEALKNIST